MLDGKKSYIGAVLMAVVGLALAGYGVYAGSEGVAATGVGMVPVSLLGAGLAHKLSKLLHALGDALGDVPDETE